MMSSSQFKVNTVTVLKGLSLIRKPRVLRAAFGMVRTAWKDYYIVQFSKPETVVDVSLPIDQKIPFESKALKTYLNFFGIVAALYYFLYTKYGNAIVPDLSVMMADLAGMYHEAGKIFKTVQTTFKRTGSGGASLFLLRLIDQEKNAAPSLHVVVASFTWYRGAQLLTKYGHAESDQVQMELFNHAVAIIESTLLIKQHCVKDIALGLVLVKKQFPDFIPDTLIDHLFSVHSYGMPDETLSDMRKIIKKIYYDAQESTIIDYLATTFQQS